MLISASLVLYKNKPDMVQKAVSSLLDTSLNIKLFVVDNSPSNELSTLFENPNVEYYHNHGLNFGFGKAHNLALSKVVGSNYHLVLNPDVYFDKNAIPQLIHYLEENKDVGLISPKICFPNGEIQYLCKRYPSLFVLFARRFMPDQLQKTFKNYLNWYEMHDTSYNKVMDVLYLSGCFMLFRKEYLDEIGWFDENIFMYFEDADITIRMSKYYRAIFYPHVRIFHHWAKGSYKSTKLALINIRSALYFFKKHGWRLF